MNHVTGWMSGMTFGDRWIMFFIAILTLALLVFLYRKLPKK